MSSEDDAMTRKIKPAKLFLKRSASTTGIGMLYTNHLNLREAKSCAGNMEDVKSSSSNEHDQNLTHEEMYRRELGVRFIETKDLLTNKIVNIKNEVLNFKGRKYSLFDVSYKWKKDCRMWLWKNTAEYKKNRSIAEFK